MGWNKSTKEWLWDKKRIKGCSKKQVEYLREIKEVDKELGRVATLNYFLLTRLNIQESRSMMVSARKQRDLLFCLMKDLKVYRVDPEWEKTFEKDIKLLQRRSSHVYRICRENLRLTEHGPYFETVGFDRLLDFDQRYTNNAESVLDGILPEMEQWEENHRAEIEKHMESVRHEIEVRDAHREAVKAAEKAEKEAKKLTKKAANDEVREIKKNAEEYRKRQRKIDREMQHYWQ